jgi:ribosomal protein S27E
MNTYYISKNGNQLGPFPVDEIQSMLMSGEIDGGDFCWTDGMEQWQSIQEWNAALRAEAEISKKKPVRREDSTEGQPCAIAPPLSAIPEQQSEPAVKNPFFKFDCPHCQQNISAAENYSGMNVQCPTCGAAFVVPSLSASALRTEEEIKVPVTPHPQPLGQRPLKQPVYQAPQMKTPAGVKTPTGPRRRKGMLIGGSVLAVIVLMIVGSLIFSDKDPMSDVAREINMSEYTVNFTDKDLLSEYTRKWQNVRSNMIEEMGQENFIRDLRNHKLPYIIAVEQMNWGGRVRNLRLP